MDVDRPKMTIALMLACLFCAPSVAASGPAENDEPACPRGEFRQQDTLELEFNDTSLFNSSFALSLPSNSVIFSAAVDMEGRPVVGPLQNVSCDFSGDDPNFVAYGGTITRNTPGTSKPTALCGNQLQSSDLGRISYSDGTCAEQWAYSWNGEYAYQHFKFKLPIDIVSNLTVTWEGYAGYYSNGYGGYGTAIAYFWNNVTLAWETVGSVSGRPGSVSKNFSGPDYVDGKGCVHVLALCNKGWAYYGTYAYNNIDTDYVKVVAQGNVLIYPKNPLLDIGANGRIEWSLKEEKFNYAVNVGDSTLTNELQTLVKNSPGRYTAIKVKFGSAGPGIINVSNFTVIYNAPPWCKGIPPDSFRLDEDTPAQRLIDLNRYFEDDQGRLQYEITFEEDPKKLDAEVNPDGHSLDFKLPTKNWWGRMQFRVRATDPEDIPLSCESDLFNVTVNPINDPPVMSPLGRQVAVQGAPYRMTIAARDVDSELDPSETLAFSDNSSLFDIDPASGAIAFTPTQDQVGSYVIEVTVQDRAGASDSKSFALEVQNAEDPPVLDPVPEQTASQDQPFRCQVTAQDPDLPCGDRLNFTDDSSLFDIGPETGIIEFTPTVKEVGVHKITITVTDWSGLADRRTFNLTVHNSIGNLDRPPSIAPIPNQTATEGQPFSYAVRAADPDLGLGDALAFSDDCPFFDIDPASGRISFKPELKDAGAHQVNITVRDRDGLSATAPLNLTILSVNHPPSEIAISLGGGPKVTAGSSFSLQAAAADPDGDSLNYTWREGITVLGYGDNLTVSFEQAGTYLITLVVSDGQYELTNETLVEVAEPARQGGGAGSSIPGFGALAAAAAVLAAIAAVAGRRKL